MTSPFGYEVPVTHSSLVVGLTTMTVFLVSNTREIEAELEVLSYKLLAIM